ncbi:hypothetical protein [Luteolibacter pohnpeiensis]|nr:hypothetical protein [Luteolibacter pohnpeiensis]
MTLLLSLALPLYGAEESPLDYVVDSLRIEANHGVVEATHGALSWPRIIDRAPTALTPWHGTSARVTVQMPTDEVATFLTENGFERERAVELLAELPALKRLFSDSSPTYSVWLVLPRLGSVEITAFPSEDDAGSSKFDLWVTQFTAFFVRPKIEESEQGIAPQSATRSELDSEGGEKPQPESEPRPRQRMCGLWTFSSK